MATGHPESYWRALGIAVDPYHLTLIALGMLLGGACLGLGMFLWRKWQAQKQLKLELSNAQGEIAATDAAPPFPPVDIHIEQGADGLRISYKRFRWQGLLGLPLLGVLIWFLLWAIQTSSLGLAGLYAALSLYVIYALLVALVNRVTIQVTRGELCISHRPLPWPGRRRLECGEIVQLYTHRTVVPGRRGDRTVSMLRAILKDGRQVRLLSELSFEATRYLEAQIEAWLGIEDVRVQGEAS